MKNKMRWDLPLLILLLLVGIAWTSVNVSKIRGYSISAGDSNSATSDVGYADDTTGAESMELCIYVVTKSGILQEDAEQLAVELGIGTMANPCDLTGDDIADCNDLQILVDHWLRDDCNQAPGCQGSDLSGDGRVDFVDFSIFGYYWRQGRISRVVVDNGMAMFMDPNNFQALPMNPIDPCSVDPNLLNNEDGHATLFEAFDFEAIADIVVLPDSNALNKFQTALTNSGLTFQPLLNAEAVTGNSRFRAIDLEDVSIVDVNIDTYVEYEFSLDGIPLLGPGAKVSASFDAEGNATQLLYSLRELEIGNNVSIISPGEAMPRFVEHFGNLNDLQLDVPQLVYYAPLLSSHNVGVIIPHYQCGGTATINGQEVTLLRKLIPATDDPNFVPIVVLNVQVEDSNTIIAQAQASDGNGPYRYVWSSSSDITEHGFPDDANRIEYKVTVDFTKQTADMNETITVVVFDQNGICSQGSVTVVVAPVGQPAGPGICDFGTEVGFKSGGELNQKDFVNRMTQGGVYPLFNWSGENAWERDFKDPVSHPNGLDNFYVDNADMTFYIGHGGPGGFTFARGKQDDDFLSCADASTAGIGIGGWGNQNLEWLALLACEVLKESDGSQTCAQRWGPAFNGLHQLLGFDTKADDEAGFGFAFADAMMGRRVWWYVSGCEPELMWLPPPVPIRAAWFYAKELTQHSSFRAAVMGPLSKSQQIGGSDYLHNYNDYFHGKGPVGPDVVTPVVNGYWWVSK